MKSLSGFFFVAISTAGIIATYLAAISTARILVTSATSTTEWTHRLGTFRGRRRTAAEAGTQVSHSTTSATISNVSHNENFLTAIEKPTFYLHVGPHKTGTSFLQSSLCQGIESEDSLFLKDNFVYLGTCPDNHRGQYVQHGAYSVFDFHLSVQPYIQLAQDGVYTEERENYPLTDSSFFLSRIEQLRKEKTNVLMVYEEFSSYTDRMIEQLKEFLSPTWNVKVLVVHRTFHDWLLSVHNEIHKLHGHAYDTWAKRVTPFDLDDSGLDTTRMFAGVEQRQTHIAQLVLQLYRRHYDNVQMVSLDQLPSLQAEGSKGDALLEYVLCHFVENAPNACKQERLGKIGSQNVNAHQDITFDLLAQEAHDQGLVPLDVNRKAVAKSIAAELKARKQTVADLPLACASDETTERFELVSMQADRNVYGSAWTDEIQAAHHESFRKLVDGKNLCHVDAGAVLRQQKWKSYFESIKFGDS